MHEQFSAGFGHDGYAFGTWLLIMLASTAVLTVIWLSTFGGLHRWRDRRRARTAKGG